MIQVTLTFEDQDALVAFFTRGATPVAAVTETAKVIEKAAKAPKTVTAKAVAVPADTQPVSETATAAPQEVHAQPEPAQASPSEPAPALTLEAVRAKLAALSQAGKQAQVKELIASMGAAKLTDVKVEQYADLMAKAGAL